MVDMDRIPDACFSDEMLRRPAEAYPLAFYWATCESASYN